MVEINNVSFLLLHRRRYANVRMAHPSWFTREIRKKKKNYPPTSHTDQYIYLCRRCSKYFLYIIISIIGSHFRSPDRSQNTLNRDLSICTDFKIAIARLYLTCPPLFTRWMVGTPALSKEQAESVVLDALRYDGGEGPNLHCLVPQSTVLEFGGMEGRRN